MNEREFIEQWRKDKPLYDSWGRFVVDQICEQLEADRLDLKVFLKIPVKHRVKDDSSLVDKAFYRSDKSYEDPYNQIEDKVGARFVVLLLGDIQKIQQIIESSEYWSYDRCKHFDIDKKKAPLLFTYQSVHYILHPKDEGIDIEGLKVTSNIKCEVQIRTLLQHAHAELTHDEIYKATKDVQPEVHRTVAKSMALIETTDDFFKEVSQKLNYGPLEENQVVPRLNSLYKTYTGLEPYSQKSSITIWNTYERFLDKNLVDDINSFLEKNSYISELINSNYSRNTFYQQSVVLFVYWMLKNKKRRLVNDWPLKKDILDLLANDLGIKILDA